MLSASCYFFARLTQSEPQALPKKIEDGAVFNCWAQYYAPVGSPLDLAFTKINKYGVTYINLFNVQIPVTNLNYSTPTDSCYACVFTPYSIHHLEIIYNYLFHEVIISYCNINTRRNNTKWLLLLVRVHFKQEKRT